MTTAPQYTFKTDSYGPPNSCGESTNALLRTIETHMEGLKDTMQKVGLIYVSQECAPNDKKESNILRGNQSFAFANSNWYDKLATTLHAIDNELKAWKGQAADDKARAFTIEDHLSVHRDDRRIQGQQPPCVHIACRLAFNLILEDGSEPNFVMISTLTCELPEGTQALQASGQQDTLASDVDRSYLHNSTQRSLSLFAETVANSQSVMSDTPLVQSDDESTAASTIQDTPATTIGLDSNAFSQAL
ncbi:hypothetical protein NliqN6_1582 [Naganishia liquefaciens]|uniref:Uncharacterized protein n=1 Tax=Naganishia liquefaciens TaxID=104408 RepID=A0A8H3YD99_9TREE|nr:hypothetical protein NliqN6_1582 [Naganishia liquefaciens]